MPSHTAALPSWHQSNQWLVILMPLKVTGCISVSCQQPQCWLHRDRTTLNSVWSWSQMQLHEQSPSPVLMPIFQVTWVSCFLLAFFLHLCQKRTSVDKWQRFLQVRCPSCHPIKALKESQMINHWPNQEKSPTGPILLSSTTRLQKEGAWLPLCWLLNASTTLTRIWANAQRDGRPAEYRWRPVLNAAKFGSRPLLECRAVTLPIGER